MSETTIPTLSTKEEVLVFMEKLDTADEWEVFWDKGWGDSPLDITVIHDGDGQNPVARIDPYAWDDVKSDKRFGRNTLRTYKARALYPWKGGRR